MAIQTVHKFRLDKPVPHQGRRRTKKKRQIDPRTVPANWSHTPEIRAGGRS